MSAEVGQDWSSLRKGPAYRLVTGAELRYTIQPSWATTAANLHAKISCWYAKFVLTGHIP